MAKKKKPETAGGAHTPSISSLKAGLSPGTPVFVGRRKLEKPRIDITCYTGDTFHEAHDVTLADVQRLNTSSNITWIDVNGIHDTALIESIGQQFGLHPLTLEDIVNTTQRPKAEEFDTYIFLVMKMISFNPETRRIDIENVSLVLAPGLVISFQELDGDVFDGVRERLRSAKGRIRKAKADYLTYALMDAVIDEYYVTLEKIGEDLEILDDEIVTAPEHKHLHQVHILKRDILYLRKSVWPLREVVSMMEKTDSKLVEKATRVFLRDLYDHTVQVIDMVETYRDIMGGMHDTYLSSVNYKLNDIMKMLTGIATIFIPLTFIVGIYGMNFEYMPELSWRWGYFATLGFMALVATGMLALFWKKGWFKP